MPLFPFSRRCSVVTAALQVMMKLTLLLRRRRMLMLLVLLAVVPFLCVAAVVKMTRATPPIIANRTNRTNRATRTNQTDAASQLFGTTLLPLTDEEKRVVYADIRRLVSAPSSETLNLQTPGRRDHSQHGQSRFVDEHLHQRRNGYFIESGASDGETGSNTLFFERQRNWTGLLIEANPDSYRKLMGKHRHAFTLNTCLSPSRRPVSAVFKPAGGIGGLVDQMSTGHLSLVRSHGVGDVNVTCYPINDVVTALNIQHVDYWSLDVEGAELAILRSIDWTTMPRVDVISIEYKVKGPKGKGDRRASVDRLQQIRQLFDETGLYKQVKIMKEVDVIFARI